MTDHDLRTAARALVAPGKGILAADESSSTMNTRLQAVGAPADERHRMAFRELVVTTPGLHHSISGIILYDETLRGFTTRGLPMAEAAVAAGLLPGIKVDTGAKPLAGCPGETVTEGLDGLRDRLAGYAELGARFAKWRAVLRIGPGTPSPACLRANAHALARYAALCQEAGLVPIVEPEVLSDGDHPIGRSEAVTAAALTAVFGELTGQGVLLEGIVLKPNMALAGDTQLPSSVDDVVGATLRCLYRTVPAAVPGIAFLSGGQPDDAATRHLDALNRSGLHPWQLTFSYGRALLATALADWHGDPANVERAQATLVRRARCNAAARDGRYDPAMEAEPIERVA